MHPLGLDVLVKEDFRRLSGQRLGLLCHSASCDSSFVHLLEHAAQRRLNVTAVFGPEHGLSGFAQYMVDVDDAPRHPLLGCPIYSLYGKNESSLSPTANMLRDIDTVVIDLQDIGTRYYTYAWTAVLMMRQAARAGISVLVLDRPNPLGGTIIEGGSVDPKFQSFVGLYDVPVRHGLTIGEMLRLVAAEEKLSVKLDVVTCPTLERRHDDWADFAWVHPSPNMPTTATALVYPGLCFLEATNISEGRGTTKPFEIIGAPFVDAYKLAQALKDLSEPGIRFRTLEFKPTFDKFKGELCGGVALHVFDRQAFKPFRFGVRLVATLLALYPNHFEWRKGPYEFVTDRSAFDLLAGSDAYRLAFADSTELDAVIAKREERATAFADRRQPALLYR